METLFHKVLVANRGVIAVRIIRTLRKLEIASVAVYTRADEDSLHVEQADEAVLIGDGPAKESYLNAELILQTALETGADAVHPGYGFLSENAEFARACRQHGITFIGPTPEQMELFGLKHSARQIAEQAGVPMLPGTGLLASLDDALREAADIGYPVILKSTAGGGGIGMRVCTDAASLRTAYDGVLHLAETHFRNGGLFLEKYVLKARHVEVQIFGNRFGEVVALGERDCSIQRRNQKVVEEGPAPNLPPHVREDIAAAAIRLAKQAGYQSAGTVEFLYDADTHSFYFLEVNTRLQVEHGVTEEVLGVDLVEWMVREAADDLRNLSALVTEPRGHSIQVRIYAEDCLAGFRPSAGRMDRVAFPDNARIETWVRDGVEITSLYDPLLAKIIVHGTDRADALAKLAQSLADTRLYGVTTNVKYLQAVMARWDVRAGDVHTRILHDIEPPEPALEVLDGGVQTTVQDWPGRIGYWDVGVPPCGPMDSLSFRIGNRLLGNPDGTPGLELTLRGGAYAFREDIWICLTGADMQATLNDGDVPMYQPLLVRRGQVLRFGEARQGLRTYLLVAGGLDVPQTLGSAATFTLGSFGGHGGRALRVGDVIGINLRVVAPAGAQEAGQAPVTTALVAGQPLPADCRPRMTRAWTIGVIPGPHCTAEFLHPDYLKQLASTDFEVHFNSSRTGVRLIGPAPPWTRADGGDAGLHPSNIHDNAYAIGALDLTGDMPILLGPDGPSLGGFVCPVTTATAELWKIGQLHPGDTVRFQLLSLEDAVALRQAQERALQSIAPDSTAAVPQDLAIPVAPMAPGTPRASQAPATPRAPVSLPGLPAAPAVVDPDDAVLANEIENHRFPITLRCSGDENLLVEYGPMELDLMLRFQVHALMQALRETDKIPALELTPGIRSLQIHLDPSHMTVREACRYVLELDTGLPPLESYRVPSRIVRLPLSWDDPATGLAISRYQQTVRSDAPWCPSNLEFIRRINGLAGVEDVQDIVYQANYLVLGLGDVYLGAPVATPVDPRHRLVTTKYNPARTWTPENAVGIGGAYLCVYGMEGPGGYQFVGRTVQMWNRLRPTKSFPPGKPWLLRFFDQIQFYPVTSEELLQLRRDFLRGRFEIEIRETEFDLGKHLFFLEFIKDSAALFRAQQQRAFQAERKSWKALGLAEYASNYDSAPIQTEDEPPKGVEPVRCNMPGSVWKVLVTPGETVRKGDTLIIVESMKMEFPLHSPCDGFVGCIQVQPGDEVQTGQWIIGIVQTVVKEVTLA